MNLFLIIILTFYLLSLYSSLQYKRSLKASIIEQLFRIMSLKNRKEKYIINHLNKYEEINRKEYKISNLMKFDVSIEEIMYSNMKTYLLNKSGNGNNIILYLHGGAFVEQPNIFHFEYLNKLSKTLDSTIIVPIYPKAPNNTYKDAFPLLERIYINILKKYKSKKFIIMGDSSGGGLALSLCQYISSINIEQPDKLILFSPWLDISMSSDKLSEYEKIDPYLDCISLGVYGKSWAGNEDIHDYRVSPIYGNINCLNNITLFVGSRELFYPDITSFHKKLISSNIHSTLIVGKNLNHSYPLHPIKEAKTAFEEVLNIIKTE